MLLSASAVQLKCLFVALTGRGVISIIQAIVGVIFSIEGFWGAVKYDGPSVKRFLIFLSFYFLVSTAISIIDLETIDEYCSTALDDADRKECVNSTEVYSYLLLAASLSVVPLVMAISIVFYLAIQSSDNLPRRRKDGKGVAYEMAEIVDRMGFSSD